MCAIIIFTARPPVAPEEDPSLFLSLSSRHCPDSSRSYDFSAARVPSTRPERTMDGGRNSPWLLDWRVTSDRTVCVAISRDVLFVCLVGRRGRRFLVSLPRAHRATMDGISRRGSARRGDRLARIKLSKHDATGRAWDETSR